MRIIGLDLGGSSIKAVEIDSAFGRYEIRDYYEQPIQEGQRPAQAAKLLFASLPSKPDKVVVALPTHYLTQRSLQIPTRDRKSIRSAVMFELEDDLPFEIENSLYDYSILSQNSTGSQIHISITLKKNATEFLNELVQNGIDPDLITSESWAYRTYLNRIIDKSSQENPILLVQIGARQTSFYCQYEGAPLFHQTIDWGGQDLTQAIAAEYGLSFDDAEQAKRQGGLRVPGAEEEDIERIECKGLVTDQLQKLILEIRQASLTCRNLTLQNPARILFCGGGSSVAGLTEILSPELNLTIERLPSLSAISMSGVSYSPQVDSIYLLATGLALCSVGQDRATTVNFRKGELARAGAAQNFNFKSLRGPLISFAAISGCLAISLVAETIIYKNKLKQENQRLEKSIRSFFPAVSSAASKTYLSSPSKLKDAINKELQTQREMTFIHGPNQHSPMIFLKSLSSHTPTNLVVDMTEFHVGAAAEAPYRPNLEGQASITFLVSNAQMIEKLTELMPKFIDTPQKSTPEEVTASNGTDKKFKITFSGKIKESAYGQ